MSRESRICLPIVTSDDGRRCDEQCEFIDYGNPADGQVARVVCSRYGFLETTSRPDPMRATACLYEENDR